mmetsp:Transcript_73479/g.142134  ORF Transcript_73479/g.142134 Transcript_73479/m.142134 type:complete len:86 (-) Transcript_73479:53-310(-)
MAAVTEEEGGTIAVTGAVGNHGKEEEEEEVEEHLGKMTNGEISRLGVGTHVQKNSNLRNGRGGTELSAIGRKGWTIEGSVRIHAD